MSAFLSILLINLTLLKIDFIIGNLHPVIQSRLQTRNSLLGQCKTVQFQSKDDLCEKSDSNEKANLITTETEEEQFEKYVVTYF